MQGAKALKQLPEKTARMKKLGFPVPTRVWLKEDKYYNIVKEEFKWSQHKAMSYLVTTELRGIDRQGILLDLAKVVSADFNINIREVNIHSHDGIFEGNVSLYVKDAESLHAVMDKLRKIKGIESVKRTLS